MYKFGLLVYWSYEFNLLDLVFVLDLVIMTLKLEIQWKSYNMNNFQN